MNCRCLVRWSLLICAPMLLGAQACPELVIRVSTMLDGRGNATKNAVIQICGERISAIGAPPAGTRAREINLEGFTLMPGWIDTHVHMAGHMDRSGRQAEPSEPPQEAMLGIISNAWKTIQGGFTTVQSVGSPVDALLRDAINSGALAGPRILTSLVPINSETGDPAAIRALVRKNVADGADLIKIFASGIKDGHEAVFLGPEHLGAACGEAKLLNRRALVHTVGATSARQVAEAGCTGIEHGGLLDESTLDVIVSHGTYLDPTLTAFHWMLENPDKFLGRNNRTEEGMTALRLIQPMDEESTRRAVVRKVKLVLGTDAVAGIAGRNAEEFIYRVKDGGQKLMDAIISGTSLAAESLWMGDRIGTIAPGFQADLVATDGNPVDDITAVRKVVFVMKGGKIYKQSVH